jgi:hypothetical protein
MLDKLIMFAFSIIMTAGSISSLANRYYHGLFTDFYGINAIVMSFGSLIIAMTALTNFIHPWIKWLTPNRWPYITLAIILWELVVRESIVFFTALN